MKEQIAWFFGTWWTMILRPIYFFSKLKGEDWKENALTFFLINCWILGLSATLIVLALQYWPIGSTLVEGVTGFKFVLILPVLITLAFVFLLITLLIAGGAFIFGFFVLFCLVAWSLHFVYLLLGGRGSFNRIFQMVLYSSGVSLVTILIMLLLLITNYGKLDFYLFRVGFNFVYFLMLLYAYGLWAVAGRKTYGVPKWQAFLGAVLPVIFLLIFGVFFDKIAISKLQSLIS